jgi:hypothetical protein
MTLLDGNPVIEAYASVRTKSRVHWIHDLSQGEGIRTGAFEFETFTATGEQTPFMICVG